MTDILLYMIYPITRLSLLSIKLAIKTWPILHKSWPKIIFKDSYLMLPYGLRALVKAFNIVIGKGYFPFLFNQLFYKGVIPAFEYWTG